LRYTGSAWIPDGSEEISKVQGLTMRHVRSAKKQLKNQECNSQLLPGFDYSHGYPPGLTEMAGQRNFLKIPWYSQDCCICKFIVQIISELKN
jgi:hypothetical protein